MRDSASLLAKTEVLDMFAVTEAPKMTPSVEVTAPLVQLSLTRSVWLWLRTIIIMHTI